MLPLNWAPPSRAIVIGDFNSVHWAWQPGAHNTYGQGEEIEEWAGLHNLSCLIVGEPTHRAGNTLDLAWTNISDTCAWVEREECITSDHLPICGSVITRVAQVRITASPLRVPKDKLPQFAQVVTQWIRPADNPDSVQEVEEFAEDICGILKDAVKAVGIRCNRAKGKLAPWWTKECKAARLAYRAAVVDDERKASAKAYRATVASAKREYWKRRIEDIRTSQDIFKLMRWASTRNTGITPPLRYEGQFISDQEQRAQILRDSLLARFSASDDLLPCTLTGEGHIPWSYDISEEEVRSSTIGSGSTSPGADGISVELLSACWNKLGPLVTHLFSACLSLGYHPICFKLAEVVFLPKTGRDPSSIKGKRPISLLSCLGKG